MNNSAVGPLHVALAQAHAAALTLHTLTEAARRIAFRGHAYHELDSKGEPSSGLAAVLRIQVIRTENMSRLTARLLDIFEKDLASDGDALALRLQDEVEQAAANAEELTYAAVRSRKRKAARVSKKASKADDGK